MRMRVCYLDCHEAELCCYLVIHTENLFRPLQPFYSYFHLCPIYWLFLVFLAYRYLSLIPHSPFLIFLLEWKAAF
jgi:hypothetical protein